MHIYHIINQFDQAYGKKHRFIQFSTGTPDCIFAKVIYDTDEAVMFKIWLRITEPDWVQQLKPTYQLILFKDHIYTNEFIMPNKDNRKHFFDTMKAFTGCAGDYYFGNYEIDIPDGMTDEEEISDYLSDTTGFCHKGFSLTTD